MKRTTSLLLAALMGLASADYAIATGDEDLEDLEVQRHKSKNQPLRTPAPTRRTTQPEVTPAKPSAKTAQAAKPSARGPGTQTEDDLYIGSRAKAAPANATATRTGQAKQTAKAGKPDKIPDEDLQEIEVQRMKMQQNAR
jgi:hypothetical protein